MQVVEQGVGHDLDHGYGTGYGQVSAYRPGYHEGSKTAGETP